MDFEVTSNSSARDPLDLIGRYIEGTSRLKFHSHLGTGTYASVYRAHDQDGLEYAVKCLWKHDKRNLDLWYRREIAVNQTLEKAFRNTDRAHRTNIALVRVVYEDSDFFYLVMDFCGGGDLFEKLSKKVTENITQRKLMSALSWSSKSISFNVYASTNASGYSNSCNYSRCISYSHSATSLLSLQESACGTLRSVWRQPLRRHSDGSIAIRTDHLANGFDTKTSIDYFLKILDAVEFCHDAGVYHRDLKPDNILFFGNESIRIADFGLATCAEMSCELGVGSIPYSAPEVHGFILYDRYPSRHHRLCFANRSGSAFDPTSSRVPIVSPLKLEYPPRKADVWSLAIILFNLHFGSNPWSTSSPGNPHFEEFLEGGVRNSLGSRFALSKSFCAVLERALCLDPMRRCTLKEMRRLVLAMDTFVDPHVNLQDSSKVECTVNMLQKIKDVMNFVRNKI